MFASKEGKTPPGLLGRVFWGKNDEETDEPTTWSMGVMNPKGTVEVPGSVLLLAEHNQPLGLRNAPARTSHSTIPSGVLNDADLPTPSSHAPDEPADSGKKKTPDGRIILEPQPEESDNDPLNWPAWRRDVALLSLGFYCMVGGGMTPLLAAGFTDVAENYHVEVETVALTTGLYMMGMGLGSVIASPTAILYGKRPVYLVSAIVFILTSVWCAMSPSFTSLVLARIFQGMSVSPVECLPSATIAEIFFLHERAFRIGIYTLLLLGGKNLVPLVSAAVIQRFGWRWAFWVVVMVVGLCFVLLFLFVPETFWDRTPMPRRPSRRPSFLRRLSSRPGAQRKHSQSGSVVVAAALDANQQAGDTARQQPSKHAHFGAPDVDHPAEAPAGDTVEDRPDSPQAILLHAPQRHPQLNLDFMPGSQSSAVADHRDSRTTARGSIAPLSEEQLRASGLGLQPEPFASALQTGRPPYSASDALPRTPNSDLAEDVPPGAESARNQRAEPNVARASLDISSGFDADSEKFAGKLTGPPATQKYTHVLREQPPRTFVQQLRPYHGRLNHDKWFKVMLRPFLLFAYPAVLWSSVVYACSVGWLIVVSESIAMIYRNSDSYNFDAIQTGLVYISPFIGGILGTAVAGKVSDVIVQAMARRNGGLYEPEFRLVMAAPVLVTTVIGLMGFGWSAQERDHWIVPTVFFGIISFGCSLGSTTAITFCVDSYRQYAGEALVTLNFSKNIFHGLVFSLFVTHWLSHDGAKSVYIWIGVIQLILLLFTIPMYIYGKRARMWTIRKNFMEKL